MEAIQRYREAEVGGVDGGRLVVVAYDGALSFLMRAQVALADGRTHEVAPLIFRAERIVLHLLASLDPSAGEVAANLQRLYAYVLGRLAEAALARNAAALDEALRILTELRSAWAQIAAGAAAGSPGAAEAPAASAAGSALSLIG